MKALKISLFLPIILLVFFCTSYAEETVEMYPIDNPASKIINMGPCYLDDSVHTKVHVRYFGDSTVYIMNGSPTIIVFKSEFDNSLTGNEFRSFNPDERRGSYPYVFDKDKLAEPVFFYYANPSNTTNPEGWFYANLHLGVAYQGSDENTVAIDTFVLKAKKTIHLLDGYIDSLVFDSVYVHPTLPKTNTWRIKSTYVDNIVTDKSTYYSLSPIIDKNEFHAKEYKIPPILPKKYQIFDWELNYSPVNIGVDSTLYFLHFIPDVANQPDVTDSISIKLIGTGVKQELLLTKSNQEFHGDTIDIGNVPTGYRETITGELQNIGNISFYAIGEETKHSIKNESSEILSVNTPAFEKAGLQPGNSTTFALDLFVKDLGIFIERYEIESDILSRDIHGVPASEIKKTIYVKGIGSTPKLRLPADTIDYGNVVINEVHCPSQRDTTILISNTGNSQLLIKNINLSPDQKFKVDTRSLVLDPGKDTVLTISFIASDGQFGQVESILSFETNDLTDSSRLVLKANGVPREKSWLNMPSDYQALPGDFIDIPIIIEDQDFFTHPIHTAKNFTTRISFDSTVLNYVNRQIIGTASEAATIDVIPINAGSVDLIINNGQDYFPEIDTLIILRMRAFLGNEQSSTVAFHLGTTKFGDGLCDDVLNLDGNIKNGEVSIDSLCGIEYKTHRRDFAAIVIESIAPNPANSFIDIAFSIAQEANVKLEISDNDGNIVHAENLKTKPEGQHNYRMDVSELSASTYYLRISSGAYQKVQSFIIVR